MRRRMLVFVCLAAVWAGMTGCAPVQPWQREYLADETMQFDPDPLKAEWQQHVREVFEGGRGGFNGTGGGCGCR